MPYLGDGTWVEGPDLARDIVRGRTNYRPHSEDLPTATPKKASGHTSRWVVTSEGGDGFTPMTPQGLRSLLALDKSFVGTVDYMGHAYFWNAAYKHYLREASDYRRRLIHKHLCDAGLDPAGESDEHEQIILRYRKECD